MATIEELLREMEQQRPQRATEAAADRPERENGHGAALPPIRPRARPLVVLDDVYEIDAVVTFRIRTIGGGEAALWQTRLRSTLVKVAAFVQRKAGIEIEAEWGELRCVGRERRQQD